MPSSLHALKGALCNLLWPGGGGCLYGHGCTPELRVSNDESLALLLDHFGEERLLSLTADIRRQVIKDRGYPWRSYLGYMGRLRDLMTQELQSPTSTRAAANPDADPCSVLGRELAAQEGAFQAEYSAAAARFDALPPAERAKLLARARRVNPLLLDRADDSPLLRAAAIALMNDSPESRVQSPPVPAGLPSRSIAVEPATCEPANLRTAVPQEPTQ